MKKTFLRLVAVAFGALLVGQTLYVEYLFHNGSVSVANAPEIAECVIAWLVVLGGVVAWLVRRATPNHVVHNHYHSSNDECDDCDDECDE